MKPMEQTKYLEGVSHPTNTKPSTRLLSCQTEKPLVYDVCGQLISSGNFLHHRRLFEYHVLILVTEGILHITTNQVPYCVAAGEYIVLKAGEEHFGHEASVGRLSYLWVHFSADTDFESVTESTVSPYLFPEYGKLLSLGRTALCFQQLMVLSLEETSFTASMLDYSLSLLMMEISRDYRKHLEGPQKVFPPVVVSVMEWIKAHYYEPFTVAQLAQHFGYQADYLSSLFKKSTGLSLTHYTHDIRIKASKTLLTNYQLSIKEAAYACGFSDEKYFMRIFKQLEGMTPTQYKKIFSQKSV